MKQNLEETPLSFMHLEGGLSGSYVDETLPSFSVLPKAPELSKDQPMTKNKTPPDEHGLSCPHGCGGKKMKSPHGLARHVKAKHGGFGGLGKILKEHGIGAAPKSPHETYYSSYDGDGGGAYGAKLAK